nr:fumarylacetoacetate hydrolase family protein [Sphingopyxis sp. BSNA05]
MAKSAPSLPLSEVVLNSPVANPSKIINAPINYQKHIAETKADQDISHGRDMTKTISDWGLFLKANSSLIGAGDEVVLRYPERRIDHEIELAVIIGKNAIRLPATMRWVW